MLPVETAVTLLIEVVETAVTLLIEAVDAVVTTVVAVVVNAVELILSVETFKSISSDVEPLITQQPLLFNTVSYVN